MPKIHHQLSVADNIKTFIHIVEKFKDLYKSLDYEIVTVKEGGVNKSLWIDARFTAFEKKEEATPIFELNDEISIIRGSIKFTESGFKKFIQSLGGNLELFDKRVVLTEYTSSSITYYEKERWKHSDLISDKDGWRAQIFHATGQQIKQLANIDELAKRLLTNRAERFRDLEQLTKKYLGTPLRPSLSSCIFVVAPIYRKVNNILLSANGQLSMTVTAHRSIETSNLSLGVIYETNNGDSVGSFSYDFLDPPADDNTWNVYEVRDNKVRDGVVTAHIQFSHDGEILTKKVYVTKPPVMATNFAKKLIDRFVSQYGYFQSGAKYKQKDLKLLELHVYELFSGVIPLAWIGLNEDLWKQIFSEHG